MDISFWSMIRLTVPRVGSPPDSLHVFPHAGGFQPVLLWAVPSIPHTPCRGSAKLAPWNRELGAPDSSLVSFAMRKLVSFIRSHLFTFAFISIALGDWPQKALVHLVSENVLPMFPSRTFIVSCLVFKSLSHFELFLCTVWGCVLTALVYMQLSNFPSTTCWGHCLFPFYSLASFVED